MCPNEAKEGFVQGQRGTWMGKKQVHILVKVYYLLERQLAERKL